MRKCAYAVLAVVFILTSCHFKKGTPGAALFDLPMIATVGGDTVGTMKAGDIIYFSGDMSPDSSTYKVSLDNDVSGWVPRWSVALNAKPAIIIANGTIVSNAGDTTGHPIKATTIIGVDSTYGEYSHFYYSPLENIQGRGWIRNADISYDPADFSFNLK